MTKNILIAVFAVIVVGLGIWLFTRRGATPSNIYSGGSPSSSPIATPSAGASATATPQPGPIITLQDGLKVQDLTVGTGAAAAAGDTVSVNYSGMLSDGTVFDSNTDPQFGHVQPFSFQLGAGQVIPGWDEGVAGMQVGGSRKLIIPPALGYGAQGVSGVIPANATLTFTVSLTGITPPTQ